MPPLLRLLTSGSASPLPQFLNFFISYADEDGLSLVTDHAAIARRYLGSWFAIDLFGGVPIDWCFPSTWSSLAHMRPPEELMSADDGSVAASGVGLLKSLKLGKLFKMFKLIKLGVRMLRLARRSRSLRLRATDPSSMMDKAWQGIIGCVHPYAWTVMKQILAFFFAVHLFACVQFATSDATIFPECAGDDGGRSCWLYRANLLAAPLTDVRSGDDAESGGASSSSNSSSLAEPDGSTLYMASFFHAAMQMINGEVGCSRAAADSLCRCNSRICCCY